MGNTGSWRSLYLCMHGVDIDELESLLFVSLFFHFSACLFNMLVSVLLFQEIQVLSLLMVHQNFFSWYY